MTGKKKRMARITETITKVLSIPYWKLPQPRLLFTIDSGEPNKEGDISAILERFAVHRVPVTFFVSNETLSGDGNYTAIREIFRFAEQKRLPLEIASHGSRHEDLSHDAPLEVGKKIVNSLREFNKEGFPVRGFRAPFLSIEKDYRDILSTVRVDNGGLRYDSSICFESGLLTSLFHILVRRKSPHKIGMVWELPVSALDDYHILKKRVNGELFAFFYWVVEINMWVHRLNYFLLLFHPHTIGKHLGLLDRFLSYCVARFPEENFMTCIQLVNELDALHMQGAPSGLGSIEGRE